MVLYRNELHLGILCLMLLGMRTGAVELRDNDRWERLAVVVSSRTGMSSDKTLQFAYRDGIRVHQLLKTMGGIPEENLHLLQMESISGLVKQLKRIALTIRAFKQDRRKIFLQFYYSGHGAFSHFHIGGEKLAFSRLKALMNANIADARVFVLDVCYGASFFNAKGFRTARTMLVDVSVEELTQGEVIITSSAYNEQSFEVTPLGGSIFTSHWLMALRGAADKNRDGQVSLFEAYNYTYHKTVAYSAENLNRPQHPSYNMKLRGGRDLMLTRPLELASGILFKNCPPGNYSIMESARKISIGDFYLSGGGSFTLALEPGEYEIRHYKKHVGPVKAAVVLTINSLTILPYINFKPVIGRLAQAKGHFPGSPSDGPQLTAEQEEELLIPEMFGLPRAEENAGLPGRKIKTTLLMGLSMSGDNALIEKLNQTTGFDAYYGLSRDFQHDALLPFRGISMLLQLNPYFSTGAKILYSSRTIQNSSIGFEPLLAPETAKPVYSKMRYQFNHLALGPLAEFTPFRFFQQSIGFDAGFQFLHTTLNTTSRVDRPLYNLTVEKKRQFTSAGSRADCGVKFSSQFQAFFSRIFLELNFRLGAFHQSGRYRVKGKDGIPNLNLRSSETGITAAIMLSLSNFLNAGWRK